MENEPEALGAALEPVGRARYHEGRSVVGVAQLVERWIVAPEVAGSSPVTHPMEIRLGGGRPMRGVEARDGESARRVGDDTRSDLQRGR